MDSRVTLRAKIFAISQPTAPQIVSSFRGLRSQCLSALGFYEGEPGRLPQPRSPTTSSRAFAYAGGGYVASCRALFIAAELQGVLCRGRGGLASAIVRTGFPCLALEAFPPHIYKPEDDFDRFEVPDSEIASFRAGLTLYAHFGITCAPWSIMNNMNGGTRSKSMP